MELFLKFNPEARNTAEVRQAIEILREKKQAQITIVNRDFSELPPSRRLGLFGLKLVVDKSSFQRIEFLCKKL